jgi:hypothetical protein
VIQFTVRNSSVLLALITKKIYNGIINVKSSNKKNLGPSLNYNTNRYGIITSKKKIL